MIVVEQEAVTHNGEFVDYTVDLDEDTMTVKANLPAWRLIEIGQELAHCLNHPIPVIGSVS